MKININMTTAMITTVFGRRCEYHRDGEKPLSKLETQLISEVTRISTAVAGKNKNKGKNEQ